MRQKTETMLCVAFMELLKKCPFSKITIQKLAGQCGVNRQTFYYHFDNIYDLMSKAFEYELVHESRIYEEVTWEYAINSFLQWMKENRVIIRNILANAELPYLKRAMYPQKYILRIFYAGEYATCNKTAGRILYQLFDNRNYPVCS